MPFRFRRKEAIPEGVRRIVREKVDESVADLLAQTHKTPDQAIHDVRRNCKKIRAVLRLVRPELGERIFRRENAWYRDTGRALAGNRDAFVLCETLRSLGADSSAAHIGLQSAIENVSELLECERLSANGREAVRSTMRSAADRMADGGSRIALWPLQRNDWNALGPGLHRTYSACRKWRSRAEENNDAIVMHEWRKAVKHLWYQLRLFAHCWKSGMKALCGDFEVLSLELGEYHDLAVLNETLRNHESSTELPREISLILEIVRRRQKRLRKSTLKGAVPLLLDEPEAFLGRMRGYWKLWRP